ncbi:MAG TPA: EF-hand domain-containing protein, partial [Luteimonas sp.]|nr:EF-hand domain-containing protein [Luteimonas sp.]
AQDAAAAPPPPPPAQDMPPPQAPVTVNSLPPDSVVGEYKIDFAAMDKNGDGNLSRAEARSNATLTQEFRAVDVDNNGRLSKNELKGWM